MKYISSIKNQSKLRKKNTCKYEHAFLRIPENSETLKNE